jgi:hypothetical protein
VGLVEFRWSPMRFSSNEIWAVPVDPCESDENSEEIIISAWLLRTNWKFHPNPNHSINFQEKLRFKRFERISVDFKRILDLYVI